MITYYGLCHLHGSGDVARHGCSKANELFGVCNIAVRRARLERSPIEFDIFYVHGHEGRFGVILCTAALTSITDMCQSVRCGCILDRMVVLHFIGENSSCVQDPPHACLPVVMGP